MGPTSFITGPSSQKRAGGLGMKSTHDESSVLSTLSHELSDASGTNLVLSATSMRSSQNDLNHLTINKLQFSTVSGDLYGRDPQMQHLKKAFEKSSVDGGQTQLVLISGGAGAGKSALSLQTKPLVTRARGFYFSGKFDSQMREPYKAIADACQVLCEDLA